MNGEELWWVKWAVHAVFLTVGIYGGHLFAKWRIRRRDANFERHMRERYYDNRTENQGQTK